MPSKEPLNPATPRHASRAGGDGDESLRISLPCSDVVEIPARREPGQTTFSAIGDVGVAADDLARRLGRPSPQFRLSSVLGFLFLLYVLAASVNLYLLKSPPWVLVFVAPLFMVLVATLAFAGSRRWKARALNSRFELKVWKDALGSLGHQAANSVNTIRANLIAFREAHAQHDSDEHLAEIEAAIQRIDAAVQKAPNPVVWKGALGKPPKDNSKN